MIDMIIEDIQTALKNEAYIAALSLVVILPDICGKAEYPDIHKGSIRYKKWFDEYIGQYEKSPFDSQDIYENPHLSGEVMYQLRCSFLHEGNPNVDKDKIEEESCKIDKFIIEIEKEKEFHVMGSSSSVTWGINEPVFRKFRLNLRDLCFKVTGVAKFYYENNKEKFSFFNYEFVDIDKELEMFKKMQGINRSYSNEPNPI